MKQKEDLEYTGEEFDELLQQHARVGDWIQPRKDYAPEGFDNKKIYPIEKISTKERDLISYAILKDDKRIEREIELRDFKYITSQQRRAVESRTFLEY